MNRVLLVARTEVMEQLRQPFMILILAFNYVLWGSIFVFGLMALSSVQDNPQALVLLEQQATGLGLCSGETALIAMTRLMTSTFGAVFFTTIPLFVAIMSGYSVLHDRAVGALPFLMLAPLSRYQLVFGKVLGALAIPFLLHLVFVGAISASALQFEVMDPQAYRFGGSAAWWVAYLLGAPSAAFLIGSLGVVISGLSKDVRTSMQYTSFFIGLLSLGFGFALFDGIRFGVGAQLAFVAACLGMALLVLLAGSRIISRDI